MKASDTTSTVRTRPRLDTRNRILHDTLTLLNEGGPTNVTTAAIAARVGISEGNLHYHFARKELIVAALFERFAVDLLASSTAPVGRPDTADGYLDYQFGWFRLMWRYRCFYRDRWALQGMAPNLGPRLREIEVEAEQRFKAYVLTLAANEFLKATPTQIDVIVTNTWIVSGYWMDFFRCRAPKGEIGHVELTKGFALILALYEPYLTDKGRTLAAPDTLSRLLERLDAWRPREMTSATDLDSG